MAWSSGDVVCLRQTWLGRVWQAHAWHVANDDEAQLVLFAPIGAEAWFPGVPIPRDDWTLTRSPFQSHIARIVRPGEHYSTMLVWDASWSLQEWYVNFERPWARFAAGFEYFDVALDLVCYPDGRWVVLDEDELEEGLRTGVFTEDDAARAHADAERLVAEWPFPTGWEDWRPEPGWGLPTLPAGWDAFD